MQHSDTAPAGPVPGPCTVANLDWQAKISAFSRTAFRYSDLLASTGGNRTEAASRLWQLSRHDAALREDLAGAACALLALGPGGAGIVGAAPASDWRRRPGRKSKLDRDREVAGFLSECLETMYLDEAIEQAVKRFGAERVPSRSSVHRYWRRQRQAHRAA